MLMMGGQVAGMRKHPFGRVDQLEDRYLGMVEAPSSNLGTSTRDEKRQFCWPFASTTIGLIFIVDCYARPLLLKRNTAGVKHGPERTLISNNFFVGLACLFSIN